MIKPLNKKVSIFASNEELYDKLTNQEIITIKLAKLDEFVDDLYHCTQYPNNEIIDANNSYKYIKQIQQDLLRINRQANNKIINK